MYLSLDENFRCATSRSNTSRHNIRNIFSVRKRESERDNRCVGEEIIKPVGDSPAGFVTRRDNYESKINFVLHSAFGLSRERRQRPSHVDPNTRTPYARPHARICGIRRIRNELFAKFMQICMDCAR